MSNDTTSAGTLVEDILESLLTPVSVTRWLPTDASTAYMPMSGGVTLQLMARRNTLASAATS